MRILLTGFEPFGGSAINPSMEVIRTLGQQELDSVSIYTVLLPVDWQRTPLVLEEAVRKYQPDGVLCLGEAAGRPALSVERIAINLLDFRIPDNSGAKITDQPVVAGGPDAYFATIPVRAVAEAIQAAGVPAEISLSAGSYLCNQTLYGLLHFLHQTEQDIPAGFLHLPCLPEQAALTGHICPSMSLETIRKGVLAAILCIRAYCLVRTAAR